MGLGVLVGVGVGVLVGVGVAVGLGVGVLVGGTVGVGEGSTVGVLEGVGVGLGVAVGVGTGVKVGTGVDVGSGVAVGSASMVACTLTANRSSIRASTSVAESVSLPPPHATRASSAIQTNASARWRSPIGSILPHISHINPAGLAVISNGDTRCSRIAEHSASIRRG